MKYDVAVIGGGPAGLMAALSAAELGRKVVLVEKNERLGVKLLLTGGGRCNLTNNIPDYHLLAASFGPSGRFLLPTFSRFGVLETLDFFQNRGLKIKTEKDNQVFPQSDRAGDVLNILVTSLEKVGGEILKGRPVKKIIKKNQKIEKIILSDGSEIAAVNYIIATGGLAYPATGSTGDGYSWLRSLGHTIKPPFPALTPLLVKEKLVKDLEGLSLATVRLGLFNASRKIAETFGPIIFTATGLSGPAALNLSRYFYSQGASSFQLEVDFAPQYSQESLSNFLKEQLFRNKKFLKNSLESLVPGRLAEKLLILTDLDQKRLANSLNRLEQKKLVSLLKKMSLTVGVSSDYERALVTGGGLDLKGLDSHTLRSKKISNLFVVGEILDLTGPTGGYNLQLAWSTGRVAGEAAAQVTL